MPIEVESPEQLGYSTITNNLSESSVSDRRLSDLGLDVDVGSLLLCYGDHLGDPLLREAIAAQGDGLSADDVTVTPGAAAALFCAATAILGPGDHMVVVRTNYATNLETPRAINADVDIVDLEYADGWALDVGKLQSRVQPGRTKMISVTCPHNPTGTMLEVASLQRLVDLAESSGAMLLVDETYRDLTHAERLPMAATLSSQAISVASMSKAYGLPGLRIGWAVTASPALRGLLLAAKEQIVICGPTIDEHIAGRVLADRDRLLPPILQDVRARLAVVQAWLDGQDTFEWVPPRGGAVGFVRFRPGVTVDTGVFYRRLLADHGTYVGAGHWFEVSDRYFRLGYAWPTRTELRDGLAGLTAAAGQART
ncbi:MAG TPA: aminotransferase class I/II-fold pyridoxal phosphate-dependent enzyme [Streptosporangiaceae bacterium]|jgi:aspartate/methionine/tyrosine aminotransferase